MSNEDTLLCFNCMSLLDGETICPNCGHNSKEPWDPEYRRPGSVLHSRYLVGRLHHKNGEGALYKGYDNNTRTPVWIREYYPTALSRRETATGGIIPAEGYEAQYKALMSDFVDVCNEVRRLSVADAVIPIESVFPQNNTVYAVFKDLNVMSLEQYLTRMGGKLTLDEALDLLLPLYNTLSNMHDRGVIHRGISPYTVFVDKRNNLYLWGFALSATRTGGSELTAELFSGYTAPEQYTSNGWQGPWTDVYGAAALLYRMVSGFVPPKSTAIDEDRPLATLYDLVMDMPLSVSEAVADAMEYSTEDRTQSVSAFTARLIENESTNTAVYDVNQVSRERERAPKKKPARSRLAGLKYVMITLFLTILVLGGAFWVIMRTYFPDLIDTNVDIYDNGSSRPGSVFPDDDDTLQELDLTGEDDGTVPQFVGQLAENLEDNQEYLARFSFRVEEEYNDNYPAGVVYDQAPLEGTPMLNRGTVILYVSKGPMKIEMIDLEGLTLEEAEEKLAELYEEHELEPNYEVFERYIPNAEPETIVSTYPAAGAEFDPRSTQVYVYISLDQSVSESTEQPSQSPATESSSRAPSSSQSSSSTRPRRDANGVDL